MSSNAVLRSGDRAGGRRLARATCFLAVVAFSTAGCVGVMGSYDLAPNGLPRPEERLRRMLSAGDADDVYEDVTGGEARGPEDDVLRLLYAGTAAYYAGRYEEGGQLLDLASALTEDRVTRSLSREALSFLTNDMVIPYTPSRAERLMLHFYGALTYMRAGEPDEAAVEARRISALLDQWQDEKPEAEPGREARFFRYLAGALFEAAGEDNDAAVAYRKARRLAVDADLERPPADSADVVVLVERGFVAHRVEQNVVVVIPGDIVDLISGGDPVERLAAAGIVSAYVLAIASNRGYRSWYHDDGYRAPLHFEPWGRDCDDVRHGDGRWSHRCDREVEDPYLLRVAWPVYRSTSLAEPYKVRLPGQLDVVERMALDVSEGVVDDFEAERGAMIARTVARAAAKLAVTKTVERKVGEKDEFAGQILGILTNIGTLVTERADTRSWNLLPDGVDLVRVRVPAGRQELTLELRDGHTVQLEPVELTGGQVRILGYRAWR